MMMVKLQKDPERIEVPRMREPLLGTQVRTTLLAAALIFGAYGLGIFTAWFLWGAP